MSPFAIATRSCATVLSLLVTPAGVAAGTSVTTVVLEDDEVKLTLSRREDDITHAARFSVDEILRKGGTPVAFDTSASVIWQIDFRELPAESVVRYPDRDVDPLDLLPGPDDTDLRFTNPRYDPLDPTRITGITMEWRRIPVPFASGGTFDVMADVSFMAPGQLGWKIDVSLSDAASTHGIHAVRYPHLAVAPIGAASNDRFALPMHGGTKINQPLVRPVPLHNLFERLALAEEGRVKDALFTYPGAMFSQFMAYWDNSAGLYLQSDDRDGYTKNLYVNSATTTAGQARLFFFYAHFNTFPGTPVAQRDSEFRQFHLGPLLFYGQDGRPIPKLPYQVILRTFRGDWTTAANLYRAWVQASSVPFIQRGKLDVRSDMSSIRTSAYGFRFQFPLGTGPVDPASELEKMHAVLDYYNLVKQAISPPSEGALALKPLTLASLYSPDPGTDGGGDDLAVALRSGVAECLQGLRNSSPSYLRVMRVSMNRDTKGVLPCDMDCDPPDLRALATLRSSALVEIQQTDDLRTCLGSSWLRSRRAGNVALEVDSSHVEGDPAPGFTLGALTGQGNWSFLCYAPADPLHVDTTVHDHWAGGGNYLTQGWKDVANQLLQGSAPVVSVLGMEHQPETQLPDFVVNGHAYAEPYDDTLGQGELGRILTAGEPVAMFKHLYHDYALWQASVPSFHNVTNTYDNETCLSVPCPPDDLFIRYRTAQLAMMGRLLTVDFSQDPDAAEEGIPDPFDRFTLDPDTLELKHDSPYLDEHNYFLAMAVLRAGVPEFLVWGRALRDPTIPPTATIDMVLSGEISAVPVPPVLGSAWTRSEPDPSIPGDAPVLILTNYTKATQTVTLSFPAEPYGLTPGGTYRIEEKALLGGWTERHDLTLVPGPPAGSSFSLTIEVPALEVSPGQGGDVHAFQKPWKILRMVTP